MKKDDDFPFVDEPIATSGAEESQWCVLIVDDEPDVHQTSVLALKGLPIEGRVLEFVHAYSAAEARKCLAQTPDIAVVLLDVVMESDDAGLQLVRHIREDLKNSAVRIILRTGQPGYAPEIESIRAFDINDYKTKAELTRARLFTVMTTAIRSYWQVHQLEEGRRGLEIIVKASRELSAPQGLNLLAQGILTQLCVLLGIKSEGLVCAASAPHAGSAVVLAAAGSYSPWIGKPLDDFPADEARQALDEVLVNRQSLVGQTTCLYFSSHRGNALAAFARVEKPVSALDRKLLEVFCANIAVAFDNAELYQKVSDIAYIDALVGLPNRNGLLQLLEASTASGFCLALVDIDGFADVNSVLDHSFGDTVLKAIAERMRQTFSAEVMVSRVGSDVFGLFGPPLQVNPDQIAGVFANPFLIADQHLRLSATSGIARVDGQDRAGAELLKNAATALKQSKAFTRGKSLFFEPEHANAASERMQLLSRLRLALSAERLFVVYQPFVDLASGQIVGAEALLRWRTEDGSFVPPDRFIPIAEQSGLMVPIGDWIMSTALAFLSRLKAKFHTGFRMAVNISQVQFREPDFVEKLVNVLRQYGVSPTNVEMELTESVAVDDIALIEQKLVSIRALGVAIAIDDFGTGYSSLNIIRQLPVNRLKIDKAFVSGSAAQNDDFGIAQMVQHLAMHLGLETIAEGIETQSQRERLLAMGVRDGQGYLFSKPLNEEDFEAFLFNPGPADVLVE